MTITLVQAGTSNPDNKDAKGNNRPHAQGKRQPVVKIIRFNWERLKDHYKQKNCNTCQKYHAVIFTR
ncbi:MAG: hypothetical protein JXA03_15760 [Bacteroidales bacterium]|nr:hypothetical protein [Bacteroidales bacterium]